MSEQYRYPPNDPFLQSRQSDVLHKSMASFLKLYLFLHNFFGKLKIFFFYILSP
ncbi:unnamed protein product, partial [Staurois parvus]